MEGRGLDRIFEYGVLATFPISFPIISYLIGKALDNEEHSLMLERGERYCYAGGF